MGSRLSRMAYRALLRAYPRGFRRRFARDLEADFLQMVRQLGIVHAWRRVLADALQSVPLTTSDAMAEDARTARLGGPILPPGESAMYSVLFDLRHAVRALLKAPVFTAITVATLALAIGATTATFSLVNAALLRPLGYHEPERLMLIHEAIPESGVERFDVSPSDYLDLAEYQHSFTAVGAYRTRLFELSGGGEPEQVAAAEISASVFDILGVGAASGRVFLADEDQRAANVAVISHALWTRRYGGRAVLGEALVLDRQPHTIVGIMPPAFEFPKRGATSNAEPADVWLPLVFNPFERQARAMMYNHTVVGRLRDGVSPAQAAADTSALARRIQDNYPADLRHAFTLTIGTAPLVDELAGRVRRPLLILLGAVALVLLVACANIANLILSRSIGRQREIGVRAALGAGRLRLFQILLLEGLVLALAGGAFGLVLAYWVVGSTPLVLSRSLPGIAGVPLDWRVLLFTAGVSLGVAVVFALVPLGAGVRRDLHDLLRATAGRATQGRGEQKLRAGLVVTSVAFAFILLVCAGLLMRSFGHLVAAESGTTADSVLTMEVRLPYAAYAGAIRIRGFYQSLEERVATLPDVRSAVISSDLPLAADGERRAFTPEQPSYRGLPPAVAVTWVHGDFFSTYGVPLLRGRPFSTVEQLQNRRVAIVGRRLAEAYWPGEDAIGKRFKWGIASSTAPWQTVIAVASDVVDGPVGSPPSAHIYVPYAEISDQELQAPTSILRRFVVAVNSARDPRALAGAVRLAIASYDPALAAARVQSLAEIGRHRTAPQRFSAMVLAGFAAGALILAAIGLYGILAFAVSERKREIGVRMALGAQPRDVLGLVVRQGMRLVAIGLLVGGAGALVATRFLAAVLFETSVRDPLTFASVPVVLGAVGMLACYLPARRAAALDPIEAVRPD